MYKGIEFPDTIFEAEGIKITIQGNTIYMDDDQTCETLPDTPSNRIKAIEKAKGLVIEWESEK